LLYTSSCKSEIEYVIDSLKEELKGKISREDETALEGYKASLSLCVRSFAIPNLVLKYLSDDVELDMKDMEETHKRYREIKEDIERIAGREICFPETDKIFESNVVVVSTDPEEIEKISKELLKP